MLGGVEWDGERDREGDKEHSPVAIRSWSPSGPGMAKGAAVGGVATSIPKGRRSLEL